MGQFSAFEEEPATFVVRDLDVWCGAGKTSGVRLGCTVEVSGVRCWQVWLLVLKAGPSLFETDSMLIGAEMV